MVGGGSRRDEGSLMIKNTNVFAALDTLKKKKKSDKEHKSKGSSKSQVQSKEHDPQVFWAPTPLNAKSWADVDDDDDDYYSTTAPLQSVWGVSEPQQSEEKPSILEDSESEEDILGEGDDDAEEEHDHEPEQSLNPEPEVRKPTQVSVAPKEAERQLSKKERKKKELAELEALLADFGVAQKESSSQNDSQGAPQSNEDAEAVGDGEKKENSTAESKSAKKKKKKDKASKEVKESQDHLDGADTNNVPDEAAGAENAGDDKSTVDVKERLKKVASAKKKKSNKEMDAAARAAAQEAAARSARLAAAKKKEKSHYNQQPVR
ncbi:nuclear ubiquitous casein and cyclin-dependent kinase substrate 1 [Neltuma alba]|uniref:nuclear ubiquitous casein and cyclin-dependent kinase substrate 1 n=1 Tax=Neltuma alba TaxID=207710 RepID=UPI0010A3799B|nr:nuclear ubiquitous casein and cyclin-dependent kinase substrate 1-like [Prosopis alba]